VGTEFLTWLDENAERVRQEKAGLTRNSGRHAAQARGWIRRAAANVRWGVRPQPVRQVLSDFRPWLAKGAAPLLADFAGQEIDFIRDNQSGRRARIHRTGDPLHPATGIRRDPCRPGADAVADPDRLVKILGNTYYADCDHSDDDPLTQAS